MPVSYFVNTDPHRKPNLWGERGIIFTHDFRARYDNTACPLLLREVLGSPAAPQSSAVLEQLHSTAQLWELSNANASFQ